mmetsp:Transcript_2815/g.4810  ORF Transcript_2815/g.4810 Transcript_2815/m.4810 type:complete len:138 (+) Transcript_2815:38-451(+)
MEEERKKVEEAIEKETDDLEDIGGLDKEFKRFEDKSLDDQSNEITSDLIWNRDNALFLFDIEDRTEREGFIKEVVGAGIFFTAVTTIDLKVLNSMRVGRNMGPLRKFLLINMLQTPFYGYFYYNIAKKYTELKRFMA